jgi:hypothetical protein
MRRYAAGLVFAGSLTLALPVGAAPATDARDREAPAVAVQQVRVPIPRVRDEVSMVLVGTALIALGAAVRRAI